MQDVFPSCSNGFNILYMVSSRIPPGAALMVSLAQKKGARVVWNQNGVAYPAWYGPGWDRANWPMATILQRADYVFYQSEFCRLSADRYLGRRLGAWEILYNCVDTGVFTPATSDPVPRGLVLLLAGTQYQYYRLETALRVLACVRRYGVRAQLLVAGRLCWILDETEASRVAHRRAAELGVEGHVTFLGPYSQADAPSVFRLAHVLLHTEYNDASPGVVVEALASGLPVVYSDSGGTPELVGTDAGIGVATERSWERVIPPDPEAMAQAVIEVAERRKEFAKAARQRAEERFDLRPWLDRHREVFQQVLQSGIAQPCHASRS